MNGRLPWELQGLFKIKLQNEDGASFEYWLAMALHTIPENSGNLDTLSKLVRIRKAQQAGALQMFGVWKIVGCVRVIPDIATGCTTGDGGNMRWIVNSHIELVTWNDVYNYQRENCILRADQRNTRRDCHNVIHRIAIPMQVFTQWPHSNIWSLLATTPECSFRKGDRQSKKKWWNSDPIMLCNAMRSIEAGQWVIRHRGVYDISDSTYPLGLRHSTWTEIFFADVVLIITLTLTITQTLTITLTITITGTDDYVTLTPEATSLIRAFLLPLLGKCNVCRIISTLAMYYNLTHLQHNFNFHMD